MISDRISSLCRAKFGPSPDVSDKVFLALFAAITLLATGLRFWNLDGVSLWGDESISLVQAQLPFKTLLLGGIDFHPTLYQQIQKLWSLVNPDHGSARVPAAIIGAVSIPALMLCLADLASKRAALFAGLLMAVSTGHVYFSQEARMYSLLILGLILVSWGAAGFSRRVSLRPAGYMALYVIGGLIMIGSHVIGTVFMAIIGCVGLFAAWDAEDRAKAVRTAIIANFLLALLAAPWILHILSISDDHPGLMGKPVTLLTWYITNMSGFPGLGWVAKLIEPFFYLCAFLSIFAAWNLGRRTLSVLLFGLIILIPLSIGLLHLRQPILEDRVVLPVIVGISMGVGVALAWIRSRALQIGLIAVFVAASAASTGVEMMNHQKLDNYRGGLAMADANGFEGAAIVTCRHYSGVAILSERSDANVYYFKPDGVLEQSRAGYWRIAAVPVHELEPKPAPEIDAWLGGGYMLENGLETMLARHDQIAFLRPWCLRDDSEVIDAAMQNAGFGMVAYSRIRLADDRPVVFVRSRTQVSLFERNAASDAASDMGAN